MVVLSVSLNDCMAARAHLDGGHDGFHIFRVKLQDAVEDANFVIAKGLLAIAMELEE